ncbi:MAG: mRNA surveillance protein pelota [Candidatus Altiarchaeota archaeon]
MKILYSNIKKGIVKVKIENLDDLWYLSGILAKGDIVTGKTERRVRSKEDSLREKSFREVITLSIIIENIEFETDEILRISGRIIDGPEDIVAKGAYHTFNVQKDSTLKIVKEKWSEIEIQRLKEAEKSSLRPKILIVVIDYGDATFALLRDSKIFYYDISKSIGGKYNMQGRKERQEEFYNEIAEFINEFFKKENISAIVISGPGFEPENFYNFFIMRYPDMKSKIFFEKCYSYGRTAVREILRKEVISKISEKVNSAEEVKNVSKLLEEIGKNSGFGIYGFNDVEKASEFGAIEILLLTDDFFVKNKELSEKIIQNVRKTSGKFRFINHNSEPGQQLNSLGGIAAILRFKISS